MAKWLTRRSVRAEGCRSGVQAPGGGASFWITIWWTKSERKRQRFSHLGLDVSPSSLVLGLGFEVWGSKFGDRCLGFGVLCLESVFWAWVRGLRFGVCVWELGVSSFEIWVWYLGIRVWCLGCRLYQGRTPKTLHASRTTIIENLAGLPHGRQTTS